MTLAPLLWISILAPALAGTPWQKPPDAVLDVLNAPEIPNVSANPPGDVLLHLTPIRYPPLADKAAAMVKVAGLRIDPKTGGFHGWNGQVSPTLQRVDTGETVAVPLPEGLRVVRVAWTADGERFALEVKHPDHIGLWVGDVDGKLDEIEGVSLNPLLGAELQWMPDQEHLLIKRVPRGHGPPPEVPVTPDGPLVKVTEGGSAASTYEARDLIGSAHDEALFTHYAESELAIVDPGKGSVTDVGEPDVYGGVDVSPDGRFVLVTRLTPPWSYTTAWYRFARDLEVWTPEGRVVQRIASLPIEDSVPAQGVAEGPRAIGWRPDADATLTWLEALDGGEPGRKVEARDRLVALPAPFTAEPKELFRAQHRIEGLSWGRDDLLLIEQWERERRWRHVWTMSPDAGKASARLLFDVSENDRYADPGSPRFELTKRGQVVLQQVGDDLFFSGAGGTPAGDRPFLDRRNLRTGKVERMFRAGTDVYESVLDVVDPKTGTMLIRRESPTQVPNVYLATLGKKIAAPAGEAVYARTDRPVTSFTDPLPQLRQIQKKIVTFQRADGTPLSFTLYLPPGHQEGTRLPTVLYAYPREFSDPGTAGQVAGSVQTFDRLGGASHLFFVLQGYAVLHNTTMPVIGDPETAYDTFVEQLVANADAAIDEAVRLGVTDPERVGVMGHSHGGLMTATLLAHSDLFRAGIARSGAYNHTIRPFGFQSERRSLYEAQATYVKLSPVMHAPRINEPLLIVHGAIDENPGTVPLQSERLFEAIRGTGGTARLLMLPYEGHGYSARESIEHTLAEQIGWFDRYVKQAPSRKVASP